MSVLTSGGDIALFKLDGDDSGQTGVEDDFVQVCPAVLDGCLCHANRCRTGCKPNRATLLAVSIPASRLLHGRRTTNKWSLSPVQFCSVKRAGSAAKSTHGFRYRRGSARRHVARLRGHLRSTFADRGLWRGHVASAFVDLEYCTLTTFMVSTDEMINVGWGSKQTQFHGSLGKSAATAVATRLPAANPSDHQLPTISWRGDGSFYCVSSYDPYSASSSRAGDSRRQVRVYARSPVALSATSEPIYGLEGAISWRPAGNLIAAVQGFGWDGGAEGEGEDRGRKDVVFLERNGLQHGQFRLREDERYRGKEALVKQGQCGWEVKQLAYSSDSEILAVWIERGDTDLGQSVIAIASHSERATLLNAWAARSSTVDDEQLSLLSQTGDSAAAISFFQVHFGLMASGEPSHAVLDRPRSVQHTALLP